MCHRRDQTFLFEGEVFVSISADVSFSRIFAAGGFVQRHHFAGEK